MPMYAKVFHQIFHSSIAEDVNLRHFFMDLLVLADPNGVVDMTPSSIAAITRINIAEVNRHIATLSMPDLESRTPDAAGRRIAILDEHRTWGWQIINYDRFRQIASEEQRREKTRNRVSSFRLKHRALEVGNAPVTLGNASNAMQKQRQKQKNIQKGANAFESLRSKISEFYERTGAWTNYEESTLSEIVSGRETADAEFELMVTYHASLPIAEKKYFPKSIQSLVQGWDKTLDIARTQAKLKASVETPSRTPAEQAALDRFTAP